jgi:hypothetical protein
MNLAMTMTAFKRADYLKTVLKSLQGNPGIENYVLHFGVEPVDQEVISVCQNVDFMRTVVTVNQERLGVLKNPFELLKRTFDTGVDGVLYLEDDVILSPDAVRLASWYFQQPTTNNYICLNLYNHDSVAGADPKAVFGGEKFSALGIGITRHQWKTHFEPNWENDKRGWDFSITALLASGMKVLQPRYSRSHHIGRERGVHYRAAMHDKFYVNNALWTGSVDDFVLEGAV